SGDFQTKRAASAAVYVEPDHEHLTPRETEVLTYLSKGFTIKEIAGLTAIKWFTVNDHIKAIYRKLNVSSRAEAAVQASKQGLV
ncbi:LuxR C-terminal-related transcriptional regulator, partial [Methylibium sp.]